MTNPKVHTYGVGGPQLEQMRRVLGVADASVLCIEPLAPGGNNRVYRVSGPARDLLAKVYHRDESDGRDRLGTEFGFCRFAWEAGIAAVPQALDMDASAGIGCYEYLPGRKLRPGEARDEHVGQAIQFALDLQGVRRRPAADRLGAASEACFSVAQHVACVDGRVQRLRGLCVSDDIDAGLVHWVDEELVPTWEMVRERTLAWTRVDASSDHLLVGSDERVLSPSDFGFHNALLDDRGRLRFFDFEYAGWDDPAKLVCDFFCQPAVPVPPRMFDEFAGAICTCTPQPAWHMDRIRVLVAVYQIKWCCIMLNIFLPAGVRRRKFIGGQGESRDLKATRLQAAKAMLARAARWTLSSTDGICLASPPPFDR